MTGKKTITDRQRRAIAALMATANVKEAAAVAKVGYRTLHRWLNDADWLHFQTAYKAAQDAAVSASISRLAAELPAAVATLAEIHRDTAAKDTARIAAAKAILSEYRAGMEYNELADRINEIETLIEESK